MANPSKAKGDKAERDAVAYLVEQVPHLVLPRAMRKLGAGRKEDTGDLHVFGDVAIQVRNYRMEQIGQAIRSSAVDALEKAANGDLPYALGMVPYPRARAGTVRWLATWVTPPTDLDVEPIEFKLVSKAARLDEHHAGNRWSRRCRSNPAGDRTRWRVLACPGRDAVARHRHAPAGGCPAQGRRVTANARPRWHARGRSPNDWGRPLA